jgi:nitrogenase molybdenum-cofactor synthesis protein NifE
MSYLPRLKGKKVLLITGGVKSWSVVAALQEVGMEIVGTSVKKSTKEDKERIKELMGEDAHAFDDMSPREMYKMLKDARADIMLSGGRSQFIALKANMPWLDINQERHHAYSGYKGMVDLVKEIDKALYNPIWEQVRTPAPWTKAGEGWQAKADAEAAREAAELAADPAKAEAKRRSKKICKCKTVDLGTIEDAILAGALTQAAVIETTHAGSGCTGCRGSIDGILEDMAAKAAGGGEVVELDPVQAEEKRRAKKICKCKEVALGTIEDIVRANGLTTVAEVSAATEAGTGCEGCCEDIEEILDALVAPAEEAPIAVAAE